ncbi:MAG: aminotransferase class I/II-fold pyridoxal phosphate-dependent enzyme [Spirochaetota bacterium]
MSDILNYSLADFFYNDNPDVLSPPEEFDRWINHPLVQESYKFFEQQLLAAPRTSTEILSKFDGKKRKIINLTSYNYLGLSTHPEVIQAAKEALDRYGLGASGAPLLSGTFDLHVKFAKMLAEFKQKEDCLLYSSGLGGNMGAIQGILRKGDFFILDEKCHKSLVDGGTLSGARMLFFEHNNPDSLASMLEKAKGKRILVAVEGVYSMDGDLVRLKDIVEVCEQYHAGIFIDEAHSTLIFGANGRGVAEHLGLEDKIGISFGTLSKSFGGVGGFVCSNARLIRYLKGYSSPWNFSCAPSPPVVAGLIKALEVATRDSSLRDRLWANVNYMMNHLQSMKLDLGNTESQVIPIIIGASGEKLMTLAAEMQQRGLFLQPVDFPAVPAHARRFRISVSAQLTQEEMDKVLNIVEDVIVKGLKS